MFREQRFNPSTPDHATPRLRQLGPADAEALAVLRRAVTAQDPVGMGLSAEEEAARPLDGFRTQLGYPAPNASFGAFVRGELVGAASIAWPGRFPSTRHKATLWGVCVAPAARGRGVGRALVQRTLDHARSQGARRVNLTVYLPNPAATALYRSLGFLPAGLEPEALCLDGRYHDSEFWSLLFRA